MTSKALFKWFCVLAIICVFSTKSVLAIMPPEVYKKRIEQSEFKAVAIVKDVTVTEETDYYIEKRVEFELVESYGEVLPPQIFYGYCKSATENMIVGGTIYYYPAVGDEVFVTLGGVGEGEDSGYITSFTILDDGIRKALKDRGFDGLEYGMGRVREK